MEDAFPYKKDMPSLPEELTTILDTVGFAICVDDGEGYEIWINQAAEQLYEITRNDVVGYHMKYLEEQGIYDPSLTLQVIEKGTTTSIMHKNRKGKQLLTSGTPIYDGEKIKRVITYCVDITRLVELEQELNEAKKVINSYKSHDLFIKNNIVVASPVMEEIMNTITRLSHVDASILITGQSGTGKSYIAKYIHQISPRKEHPFIQINCGAIPENLIESELFGYEGGAFTGSSKGGKKGLFEVAKGGTVFLDEISELPLHLQVKLLQVLQEREIKRIGGHEVIPLDIRIISATNQDLEKLVGLGLFREDLFYRLNVIPIHIPPLSNRPEDLVSMTKIFLTHANKKFGTNKFFTTETMVRLLQYSWPGNIRQLENVVEQVVLTSKNDVITPNSLPPFLNLASDALFPDAGDTFIPSNPHVPLKHQLHSNEKQILEAALEEHKTTRKVAEALGINQSTVVRKIKKYGITLSK
jgi:transcriptional regulator with PAS, ATPase and Fis domain